MKLRIAAPSEHVLAVAVDVDGQTETVVLDTALGTKPEAFSDFVSDRGGTAPVDTRPGRSGDASQRRMAGL